ncbi:MAG: hypothetical protein RBS96_02065 [Dehalococcoidales bacterium]|jgi:hypothetical protein|nr:hypothetical protein [Dehalococcoidales bacterium]
MRINDRELSRLIRQIGVGAEFFVFHVGKGKIAAFWDEGAYPETDQYWVTCQFYDSVRKVLSSCTHVLIRKEWLTDRKGRSHVKKLFINCFERLAERRGKK